MNLSSRLSRLERDRAKRGGCLVCGGRGKLVIEVEGVPSPRGPANDGCPSCGAAMRIEIVEYRGAAGSAA